MLKLSKIKKTNTAGSDETISLTMLTFYIIL